jgi:GNAT superfamily N-acetyltransferase
VHAHLPIFAWLIGASPSSAWSVAVIWCFTIASASIVNALAGREAQVFVAGLSLSIGLVAAAALPESGLVRVAGALFLTKVAFSFAVDHFRRPKAHGDEARALDAREHDDASEIIARAFASDPLFVATCGDDPKRRVALASFLLDMTRLTGGTVRARSMGKKLVAVSLIDRPAASRPSVARYALVFVRFVPTVFSLGLVASRRLNEYFALLAVDPDAQGRGVGGAMIEDAIALARSMNASALALDTENPTNVTLYERYGFALERAFAIDPMRVFVMRRSLSDAQR